MLRYTACIPTSFWLVLCVALLLCLSSGTHASSDTAIDDYYQTLASGSNSSKPATNGTTHWNGQVNFFLSQYHSGMPHSYQVPDHYWRSKEYLDVAQHPVPLDSQVAIEDRVCTKFGLNLYDGATWEIALSLEGQVEIPRIYERTVLYSCSTGANQNVGGLADIKADTPAFLYGASQIAGNALPRMPMIANYTNPNDGSSSMPGAFYFRMVSQTYITDDPLIGSYAHAFVYPNPDASGPSWNTAGVIIWNDWKPITGENVWGAMIGPLQTLYISTNGSIPKFSTYNAAPHQVQLAMSIIPALVALQSPEGAIYHCPQGTGIYPADPGKGTTNYYSIVNQPTQSSTIPTQSSNPIANHPNHPTQSSSKPSTNNDQITLHTASTLTSIVGSICCTSQMKVQACRTRTTSRPTPPSRCSCSFSTTTPCRPPTPCCCKPSPS
jgi:hypothetical protein